MPGRRGKQGVKEGSPGVGGVLGSCLRRYCIMVVLLCVCWLDMLGVWSILL